MTRARIALLHHAGSFFPLDVFQRTREVAELIWVLDDPDWDAATRQLLRRLGEVVDIADLDDDAAAERIAATAPDGILTFAEELIPRTADIAQRLGLRFHSPDLARILTDKGRQRAALAGSVASPRFAVLPGGATADDLAAVADRVGFPCVLKPASGSGSRGIRLVHDREELSRLSAGPDDHVVEEYLRDGDDHPPWAASYLSVETVVVDGVPHHVALTGRFPLGSHFRETGNFIPALASDAQRDEILAMTDRAVAVLGVRDSVLHTEIKLTPDGPRLIEINGRLGGRPGYVLAEVSDVNLHAIACQVAAGVPVGLDGLVPVTGVGFWLMLLPPEGAVAVETVEGLERVAELTGVRLVDLRCGPGEEVDWRDGTDSQVVTVRGAVPDHDSLAALARAVRETVRIEYAGTHPGRVLRPTR